MYQNVTPSKHRRIFHHIIGGEPHRRVVPGDDGSDTDANHDVHLYLMAQKLTEYADVRNAPKSAPTQHKSDTNAIGRVTDGFTE